MANDLRALVEGRFEKIVREFPLVNFINILRVDSLRIGDGNNVLQR